MTDEMEDIINEFIAESEETLDKVDPLFVELEAKGEDHEIVNKLFRSVHTIKGAAGFLGFQPIVDVAHGAENIMKKVRDEEIKLSRSLTDVVLKSVDMLRLLLRHIKEKDGKTEELTLLLNEQKQAIEHAVAHPDTEHRATSPAPAAHGVKPREAAGSDTSLTREDGKPTATPEKQDTIQTLRVDMNKIDKVMDLTGEMVLARNRLVNIMSRLDRKYTEDRDVQSLTEAVSFLDLITSDMQLKVMKMRMQPLEKVFNKFPRLVRDISGALGKTVELTVSGQDTEVDKSVIEHIGDALVHSIRNAIDHGIELPAERKATGKPEIGRVTITASQKGSQIVIEISDDGRGIDVDKVKCKAIEKGILTETDAAQISEEAAIKIIFLPGFSTAEVATELSGRGVGMDVVKTNISKLNGSIDVNTRKGLGTTFTIHIPLTLAIIQTLMVGIGEARYAIPLAPVEESIMIAPGDLSEVAGVQALVIRGKMCPLFNLAEILGQSNGSSSTARYAVVAAVGDRRFCLGVDRLFGQEEVVTKHVSGISATSSYILGASITGEGKVVFVLDLALISKGTVGAAA